MITFRALQSNIMGALHLTDNQNATTLKVVHKGYVKFEDICTSGIRYGFNGKENDNEVKGNGNQQNYGMRIYDTRLGRFLSIDPLFKTYPFYTLYQFAGNSPILFVDMDGLERKNAQQLWQEKYGKLDLKKPPTVKNWFTKRDPNNRSTGWNYKEEYPEPKPELATFSEGGTEKKDTENPLERETYGGDDIKLDGRVDMSPKYDGGNLKMDFTPATGDDGKPIEGTYELGIIDADGKEKSLVKTTTTEPGSINTDFKLKEGEKLYERRIAGGTSSVGATKTPDAKEIDSSKEVIETDE